MDGTSPGSRLVLATDKSFYGTTLHGGLNGAGSVFRLTSNGDLTTLYSFSPAANGSGNLNYDLAPNELAQGADGILYGTTSRGGSNFAGNIFAITTNGSFSELHSFSAPGTNSSDASATTDGGSPTGALVQAQDLNFYGTTQSGGLNGTGTIFRINPGGSFVTLYSFPRLSAGAASTNGAFPNPIILGTNGAFYGTTRQGGIAGAGTFFKFTVSGGLIQLASFNGAAPTNSPVNPDSALVQGLDGNFYGTAGRGGLEGGGGVFKVTSGGVATMLYSFPLLDAGASDSLAIGDDGSFYGTISANGVNGEGAFFRVTSAGLYGVYLFSTLTTNGYNRDGANPLAAPVADGFGHLYGTCSGGGAKGSGVIYQITEGDFQPPSFLVVSNPPPAHSNTLAGASVTLTFPPQPSAGLTFQWLRNGSSFTDTGDISGSQTDVLTIQPVLPVDVGSYALVISNAWGSLTSSTTALTISPPTIAISSPKPNATVDSDLPVFTGIATNAPVTNGIPSNQVSVVYSINNLFLGSNITGMAPITNSAGRTAAWSFSVKPFPGTNVLTVHSVDASGNASASVSQTFFYAVPSSLTVLSTGSGAGSFTIPSGTALNLGQAYSIKAIPNSSVFSNWNNGGAISYFPTLQFVMQSNLTLTAYFLSKAPPSVSIAFPQANARIATNVFHGSASSAPRLPGVSPTNLSLSSVTYWLTNSQGSVVTGLATFSNSDSTADWTINVTPSPGTNVLAVQSRDVSGGASLISSRPFFYKVASPFTLLKSGNGNGAFAATASIKGDAPPTNGALLNIGEAYSITAMPDKLSRFTNWIVNSRRSNDATLTFVMQANLKVTGKFDALAPRVTISSPTPNLRTAAPVFNGTASGLLPITNIICSLTSLLTGSTTNAAANITSRSGTSVSWSASLTSQPGTNELRVVSVDSDGVSSIPVSRRFFYKMPGRLTLILGGDGSGSFIGTASIPGDIPPSNGAMLNVGEAYTITAVPDQSSLFSNWTGAASTTTAPSFSFIMQSNTVLTATFVTNFYSSLAGTYNGLFFPASGSSPETSGMVYNLLLDGKGLYTATILTLGQKFPVSSRFDGSGASVAKAGPFQINISIDRSVPLITGTVSSPLGLGNLTAEPASVSPASGEYTMLFSPPENSSQVSPPGYGYATITNHSGAATLNGALADGSSYNQTVAVSANGDIPVYASLYTGGTNSPGLLLGWINITNVQTAAPTNTLSWIKRRSGLSRLYTNGFTNTLTAQVSPWAGPAVALSNGNLHVFNSDVDLRFTNITVENGALVNVGPNPTNSLVGTLDSKSGRLTITFKDNRGEKLTASGAFLQNVTNAGGFFLTRSNAGGFTLQP